MKFDPTIFKAYDIRGTFPDQMNAGVAEAIGRALADFLPTEGAMAVGRDMRLDSRELAEALIRGLTAQGRDVVDIGLVTTEMIYFAVGHYDLAGGAMVTASHNPGQYNGFKLCGREAATIGGETGLAVLKTTLERDQFKTAGQKGTVTKRDTTSDWITHALGFANEKTWPPYKVAVDAGNGMAGKIVEGLESKVPLKITPLFFEPDGNFPNHVPNPAVVDNLKDLIAAVISQKLDFGMAFDGDGDRTFFVDETGQPVSASVIAAILARDLLAKDPGQTVLYVVRMSRIVPETITAAGGKAVITPVGGGFIRPAMHEQNALLATEGAGHYYFRANNYCDSGLITAVIVTDILARAGGRFSELTKPFMKYADSGEINVTVIDAKSKIEAVSSQFSDGQQDRLDGLTVSYPDWWFNLRTSNTEPLLRLNVEADTTELMKSKRDELVRLIEG